MNSSTTLPLLQQPSSPPALHRAYKGTAAAEQLSFPERTEEQLEHVCTCESTEFIALNSRLCQKTVRWLRSNDSNLFQLAFTLVEKKKKRNVQKEKNPAATMIYSSITVAV